MTRPRRLWVPVLAAGLLISTAWLWTSRKTEPPPASSPAPAAVSPTTAPAIGTAPTSVETAPDPVAAPVPYWGDPAWAEARRVRMSRLIREDPEAALAEALTPRQYAALPPEIQSRVERPVAATGFFGVAALCTHGPDEEHVNCEIRHEVVLGFGTFDSEVFRAHVYGKRRDRMTTESDAIYGVALDGHIALHEDGAVLVDDSPGTPRGRYAVYYRDQVRAFDDREAAEAWRDRMASIPASDG